MNRLTSIVTWGSRIALFALILAPFSSCNRSESDSHRPPPTSVTVDATESDRDAPLIEIPNARRPLPGILAGGQPTEPHLEQAAEAGFKTVINLRAPGEFEEWNESNVITSLGMSYVQIPVSNVDDLNDDNVLALANALESPETLPAMIYCASGNRVGALLAVKAHRLDGLSVEDALELGLEAGLTRLEQAVRELLSASAGSENETSDQAGTEDR